MDDLYLENIDEFVNDQNKIVTYKWLSLTLGVHVNQAKQMLYHYLEQKRKESSGTRLHATYLVSGKFTQNGNTCHKVAVVREDQLEGLKSKMIVTASVHVYSIQKVVLKDSGPLFNTDYDAIKENLNICSKYSAIRCASAVPRSSAEISRLQEIAQGTPPASEGQQAASKPSMNGHSPSALKPATQQPKGIMGMFASKAASKHHETGKEVKTEAKEDSVAAEASNSKPTSKGSAMSNFFGKTATRKTKPSPQTAEVVIKEEASSAASPASKEEEEPSSSSAAKQVPTIKEEKPKTSEAAPKKRKDSKTKAKRLERSDSEDDKLESQQKKRRRIKKPQPDSSDDEIIPDSPPARDVKTPSPPPEAEVKKERATHTEDAGGVKRRKRRKVLKSKTSLDDEGCIVTEKVYESESYSDSEDDFVKSNKQQLSKQPATLRATGGKKVEDKKSQKKSAANKGTKQASIMGFFQKK